METILSKKETLKEKVNNFIFDWHRFPIDFWWREKYKIPFGSIQHREMNFIDMLIEYQEELLLNKILNNFEEENEDESLGLVDETEKKVVKLSSEEIDKDFEDLDLEQFNKE